MGFWSKLGTIGKAALPILEAVPVTAPYATLGKSVITAAKSKQPARHVIGLSGKMGVGKDAVAALLIMLGYYRLAYADALRDEVVEALRTREIPDGVEWPPLALDALMHADAAEVHRKPTSERMRVLLQWWGTEYRRASNDHYWLDIMAEKLKRHPLAAISDVRFPNEADLIRESGGTVWEVRRPSAAVKTGAEHISEALLFRADYVIHNSGTLEDLAVQVLRALTVQGKGSQ